MTKYIVALVVLIAAGGAFLYTTQTAHAPTQETPSAENPFGDGANVVGTVNDSDAGVQGEDDAADNPTSGGTNTQPGTGGTPPATDGAETPSGTGATPGTISRAELAKHNTQANCWVGYKGVVYDITNWLPRHPGSAGAIAPFCGTAEEFAAAFNQQHGTRQENRLNKEGVKEGTLSN